MATAVAEPLINEGPQIDAVWLRYFASRREDDRNAIVAYYWKKLGQRIAFKFAQRLPPSSGITADDLLSVVGEALIDVVERFDSDRGYKFETFAGRRIHGAMQDYMRKLDFVPRLERQRQARGEVEPAVMRSLDRPAGMDEDEHPRAVPDRRAAVARTLLDDDALHERIKGLSSDQQHIFRRYYRDEATFKQIGRELNISESRVSQLHTQAMVLLRERMADHGERVPSGPPAPVRRRAGRSCNKPKVERAIVNQNDMDDLRGGSIAAVAAAGGIPDKQPERPSPTRARHLLEAFSQARIEDVRAEIERLESELRIARALLSAIYDRDGEPEPESPSTVVKYVRQNSKGCRFDLVAPHLLRQSMTRGQLIAATGMNPQGMGPLLRSRYLLEQDGIISLTEEGRERARDLAATYGNAATSPAGQ